MHLFTSEFREIVSAVQIRSPGSFSVTDKIIDIASKEHDGEIVDSYHG